MSTGGDFPEGEQFGRGFWASWLPTDMFNMRNFVARDYAALATNINAAYARAAASPTLDLAVEAVLQIFPDANVEILRGTLQEVNTHFPIQDGADADGDGNVTVSEMGDWRPTDGRYGTNPNNNNN